MSSGVFANRNMALGFAGLVVVVALFAPTAIGMLVPQGESDPTAVEQSETPTQAEQQQPTQPEPTWADETLADDWNTDTVRQANGFSGWASGNNSKDEIDESFADYSPASPTRSTGPSTGSAKPRKVEGQGIVTSRAAPGAPAVEVPGGSAPPGVLEQAD